VSVLPSGNHRVRFLMQMPGLADTSGVAGHGSFDGHPWPWLPISALRRQLANLHSFVVTGPESDGGSPLVGRARVRLGAVTRNPGGGAAILLGAPAA